jgi:hypothetical protein
MGFGLDNKRRSINTSLNKFENLFLTVKGKKSIQGTWNLDRSLEETAPVQCEVEGQIPPSCLLGVWRDTCSKTEYEQRKAEWANRYTNLDSLRDTFGSNRNKLWGDLDAATSRRLYKTLLPKALLELVKVGVQPEDLAPLAYQARVAAKLYARERCQVPARTAASLFDGFRQWKQYGKFQTNGMSYDQVWDKYHKLIMEEKEDDFAANGGGDDSYYLTPEDVTAKICLKILERSCVSNEHVDRWVLPPEDQGERADLQSIAQTLESDVRKLLVPMIACNGGTNDDPQSQQSKTTTRLLQQYRILRLIARAR